MILATTMRRVNGVRSFVLALFLLDLRHVEIRVFPQLNLRRQGFSLEIRPFRLLTSYSTCRCARVIDARDES